MPRDDFSAQVKRSLAERVGFVCSSPDCRASTSGPQKKREASINLGSAAHITAASPGGPRYDSKKTAEERRGIDNGIWLCRNCATLVDADESLHSVQLLQDWKSKAEERARIELGRKRTARPKSMDAAALLRREDKLRAEFEKHLLKPLSQIDPRAVGKQPWTRFLYSRVIVREINDESYPESDSRSEGISPWFRLGTYDFYHRGMKFALGMLENGIIDSQNRWALVESNHEVDEAVYQVVYIRRLGLIPFRNIQHCRWQGDEYYAEPHLFCSFSINGMPYESFEYRYLDKTSGIEWPLRLENRLDYKKSE